MANVNDRSPSEARLERDAGTGGAARIDAPSGDGWQGVAGAYKSYYRWLRLKRLALAAFVTVATLFLLWAIPWLPSGLDTDDYTPEIALTTYLLVGVALTFVAAMSCQELARRGHDRMLAWTSLYDGATGLRKREYLYDRLSLECDLADNSSGVFSILVLRVSGKVPALGSLAGLVGRETHRSDVIALLSARELAILSVGVGEKERETLLERLRGAVVAELSSLADTPPSCDVRGGAATYGVDGSDASTLIQAARTTAEREMASHTQAA